MSDDLVKRLRSKIIVHTDAAVWMVDAADRIEELEKQNASLETKLAMAVDALKGSRETILQLVNSRNSEAEGTDEDWVGDIDDTLAEIKGEQP